MDPESADRFDAARALVRRRGRAGERLLKALRSARVRDRAGPEQWAPGVAAELGLPAAEALGPATYYADLAAPHGERHVRVCTAAACFAAGGGRHVGEIEQALGVRSGTVAADGSVSLQPVRCLGYCYAGPACLDGDVPHTGADIARQLTGGPAAQAPPVPAADTSGDPVLLAGVVAGDRAWQVWPLVASSGTPDGLLAEVGASGLRGRGGAGFPVAAKWRAAARSPATVVVANGDEGDPGSFADRLLMEADPGRVLEGLALACFACGARRGVVLVRSEYPAALSVMRAAVRQAYADGHLGPDVHGSGTALDFDVVAGAGSYVAGEETALIAGLEGGRGCARARPPYPTQAGLWDAPTVVNNVETLASLPWIVRRGGGVYARRGVPGETGTKLVCLSERFARPGCYEVEMGTSVARIVQDIGGGLRPGAALRVLQVGGPLGGFLAADRLDVPLTEAGLSAAGAALGHAGMVAFDQHVEPREVLRRLWEFAAAESCGACSPCRVGSRQGLEHVTAGSWQGPEYARLLRVMSEASLCAFGKRVPAAVRSLTAAYAARPGRWDG